jgi:hypothetical protein
MLQLYSRLRCNIMYLGETTTFLRNISPPSSGSITKPRLVRLGAYFCLYLAWITLRPWTWRLYVLSKRRVLSELHGVTTQKAVLVVTTVRTWNAAVFVLRIRRSLLWLRDAGSCSWPSVDGICFSVSSPPFPSISSCGLWVIFPPFHTLAAQVGLLFHLSVVQGNQRRARG